MNWDQVQGNWRQLKGKVRQMWGDLTDQELDVIEGKREELIGRYRPGMGSPGSRPKSKSMIG